MSAAGMLPSSPHGWVHGDPHEPCPKAGATPKNGTYFEPNPKVKDENIT